MKNRNKCGAPVHEGVEEAVVQTEQLLEELEKPAASMPKAKPRFQVVNGKLVPMIWEQLLNFRCWDKSCAYYIDFLDL